jgi:ribosomal protein S18 acetylase RimI-like enzyme
MEIVRATIEDYDDVNKLLKKLQNYHHKINPNFPKIDNYFSKKEYKKAIKDNNIVFFLAKEENKSIGIIVLTKNKYDKDCDKFNFVVSSLYVKTKHRRQGVAFALMDAVMEYCLYALSKNPDKYSNTINLTVWKSNEDAFAFYDKYGFYEIYKNMGYDLPIKKEV